ncbi:hypothetical protein [Sphingomonas elodea]|uniref:hypothetical protein n=1 Tax=Sphingomonas elodea TaxID=179878 RepID=UPI001110BB1D|nr:hypothetical protein [Sphingomonas elodea]
MLQSTTLDLESLPPGWIETAGHPGFGAAAKCLAANILAVAEADRKLAAVFKDAGHYMTAMSAAYLEAQGELTLSTLRQICSGSGLLTANRAGALIDFMMHIGFLERESATHCRTTPEFRQVWSGHLAAALEPATMVDPSLAPVRDAIGEAAVYNAFLTLQAKRLHALARLADPFPALRATFLHPLAGCSILHMLTLACTDAAFQPLESASVSLSALSRRFGVSQPHVRRVLKRAEANRYLLHLGPSLRAFHPVGFRMIRLHYAMQISELIDCARKVRPLCQPAPAAAEAVPAL